MDKATFAIDRGDISKTFGGEGMEGMAMGRDGSMGEIRMRHDFVCVSLVGAAYPEALPVNVKLAKGRKSKGFKKIMKFLSDNPEKVSMRTHALLAGIRALVNEAHLRFISGRPRKRKKEDDRQMFTGSGANSG